MEDCALKDFKCAREKGQKSQSNSINGWLLFKAGPLFFFPLTAVYHLLNNNHLKYLK